MRIESAIPCSAYCGLLVGSDPFEPNRFTNQKGAAIMKAMAKTQTNGKIERLSPERLAELTHPPAYKTVEERRAALKRATEGFRVKVRVTPDMYGRR
jgi:hypothetical protein